jgi:hypothetical protein
MGPQKIDFGAAFPHKPPLGRDGARMRLPAAQIYDGSSTTLGPRPRRRHRRSVEMEFLT